MGPGFLISVSTMANRRSLVAAVIFKLVADPARDRLSTGERARVSSSLN